MGSELALTRAVMHRVATHVLARRRYAVSGRFGLRPAPLGIATPAFGPEPEQLRTAGTVLVREIGGEASCAPIDGSTLAALAEFAGADLSGPFDAGPDTPDLGDPDVPLQLDPDGAAHLAAWWSLAYRVLDAVVASMPAQAAPATIQIWPEHFDAATNVDVAGVGRVNLGFSPGDSWSESPYAYIGPWGSARPGESRFWNAPFGAALPLGATTGLEDTGSFREFFDTGLAYLRGDVP